MSCQIRDNKYYAPNGKESQLHKDLVEKVGNSKANDLFVLAYSDSFGSSLNQVKTAFNRALLNRINTFQTDVENLSYKVKKVNGFETIQMYQDKKMLGYIRLKPFQDGLQVEKVLLSAGVEKGKGLGTELYKRAIQYSTSRGLNLYSDASQTQDAKKVWSKLQTTGIVSEEGGRFKVEALPKSHFDKNGESKAIKVIEFARQQNENTEPLTTAEKIDLQIQFPNFETSDDLLIELEKAFYKDGLFNPTKKSLTKSLYTNYEAENLLGDINLLSQVKDSLERLKRTETVENSISLEEQFKSSDLNMFGKFKLLNPYIVKQDIIEQYGGVENVDISEIQDKSITEEYLKEFKRIPVVDENLEPVLDKQVYENAAKVIDDPSVFDNLNEEQAIKKLLDYGIDIKGKVLRSLAIEDILALNNDAPQREAVIKIGNQERDLVYLETLKTEERLFNELNLIQTETPNVYHRVEKVDEQELRDFLKAEDNVAEYQLYKDYYGYNAASFIASFIASPIETDIDYLKEEFVADFNAEILKNPEHEFYNKFEANEKGIVLKYDDPISISQINAYLKDGVKLGKELADYSVISKNMPSFKDAAPLENSRISAVNNKNRLKKPTTQVTQIDRNSLLAKNETADFINYNNEVYELKNKEGYNSVYTKLNTLEDLNYYQTEVQTQEYVDQVNLNQQKLENYNKIKKTYKNEDLGDNFDCVA